jgi:type II secretory pathway component PulK
MSDIEDQVSLIENAMKRLVAEPPHSNTNRRVMMVNAVVVFVASLIVVMLVYTEIRNFDAAIGRSERSAQSEASLEVAVAALKTQVVDTNAKLDRLSDYVNQEVLHGRTAIEDSKAVKQKLDDLIDKFNLEEYLRMHGMPPKASGASPQ